MQAKKQKNSLKALLTHAWAFSFVRLIVESHAQPRCGLAEARPHLSKRWGRQPIFVLHKVRRAAIMQRMSCQPQWISTEGVNPPPALPALTECLDDNAHHLWAVHHSPRDGSVDTNGARAKNCIPALSEEVEVFHAESHSLQASF